MIERPTKFLLALLIAAILGSFCASAADGESISLAGEWQFSLDEEDVGVDQQWYGKELSETIELPGTTDEAGYGEKTEGSTYGALSRVYKYVGPAWYKKEVIVPADWRDKKLTLFLERVLWESTVWLDGEKIGSYDSLGTPHSYELGVVEPGEHTITVRVDNSMIHMIGEKGHAYGDHMQTIWNGVVGEIKLEARPAVNIGSVKVWPDIDKKLVKVVAGINNETDKRQSVTVDCGVFEVGLDGVRARKKVKFDLEPGEVEKTINLFLGDKMELWDEFDPTLYRAELSLKAGGFFDSYRHSKSVQFGCRKIGHDGTHFVVNGRPTYMRGNLDNVHFPLTGYPAMDVEQWRRIWEISKSYGLNHIRFHSWCPPEAAFEAADKVGIYLQPEIGIWIDKWMLKDFPGLKLFGKDEEVVEYVKRERDRILEAYGNHPSFVMMGIGNELGGGDFDLMAEIMDTARERDPRRLYATSTARQLPESDDYYVSHRTNRGGTRGLRGPSTAWDYDNVLEHMDVPVIAHELGQWPVYPDFDEIDKYTGVLRARNLEGFRESARERGLLELNEEFHEATGALNVLLYKAEIEANMRSEHMAGFHLLGLQDYSGQGEALIGTLDSFYDSKGITTPEKFMRYCDVTVPLLRIEKREWRNDETLAASLQISHFGEEDIAGAVPFWKLVKEDGEVVAEGEFEARDIMVGSLADAGSLSASLEGLTEAQELTITAGLENTDIVNSWKVWVFPAVEVEMPGDVMVAESLNEDVVSHLEDGGRAVVFASNTATEKKVESKFMPVYWSLTWFPGQAGGLGHLIRDEHEALAEFPTDMHTDWQWWDIARGGHVFILNDTPFGFRPIVQPIDDFHRNNKLGAIFETRYGDGKLLVCSWDLPGKAEKSLAAKQLLYSLMQYVGGDEFLPEHELDRDLLGELLMSAQEATLAKLPEGKEKAVLFVDAAGEVDAVEQNVAYDKSKDDVLVGGDGFGYSVAADGMWRDSKGAYWFGEELAVTLDVPEGFIGTLYVHFQDSNMLDRKGEVRFEGRPVSLGEHKDKGKWVAVHVMREDTLDGTITLGAKVTDGPNLMISAIAVVPEG
ncbi:Beta-glucuronidase [Anaerohalosphaera lusitana]|uniref:Beta-glucuronidase n=1 Tax=Anaerohalosphaera lusitana TaxID=1936003 RepID=A0A1U9NP35_9BACT|nr:sugar-binding domain-containing protein [Anaerohalosphaera lusitana]AQT69276.1 Beta-glucuronidase [Anaerohalosphaera lusitana]